MTIPKSKEQVLAELKQLIDKPGYIYALCLILFEDFHHDLNKLHMVDYRSQLSVKECSLILGLLVQKELDLSIPESPEIVIELKERTDELMHELHIALSSPQISKIRELIENQTRGEALSSESEDKKGLFTSNGGIVEPTFYAGDGVYDFQYLEYLDRKYKYDKDWLQEKREFSVENAIRIVQKIKELLHEKSKKVNLIDKDKFAAINEKVRKKQKKSNTPDEQIEDMLRQNQIAVSFYQYKKLFPSARQIKDANAEDWKAFYHNLIDLFVVRKSDFADSFDVESFFKNFSFSPNINQAYEGPGYYNILNAKPLIELDRDRYFVPINYLVAEAVYESPYYWMAEDNSYHDKLSKHRGDVGEEIAYAFLSKVFGIDRTFKSVLVTTKKGQPETDIDVLCVLGNKALCVQVKSKKMTLLARRGDVNQLAKDFKGAIQDAYDQGIISRSNILNKDAKFTAENGRNIDLSNVDEVYVMGLTTENYPSLVHQVHSMLVKDDKTPFPLFISIFDLELLAHYLPDPYDFLYYVRQRISLIDYFFADEELVYLGYHLKQKLCKIDGYNGRILDSSFGANIDRNYYPFKTGQSQYLSKDDDPLNSIWKDPKFDYLADILKSSNHPKTTSIIFNLLDWSGDSRKDIVEQLIRTKNNSKKTGELKSIAAATAPDFGVSYITINPIDLADLSDRVEIYSNLKKYELKCNAWLGLGSFANSPNLVDFMLYLDEPWVYDPELEAACTDFRSKRKKTSMIRPANRRKIGRNDPCPCNSGLKYKKCCGN